MFSGFQSNAFQNNAFQILRGGVQVDDGAGAGGSSGHKKPRFTQSDLGKVLEEYKRAFSSSPPADIQKEVATAVAPYVKKRYAKQGLIYSNPAPANQINFDKLLENSASLERLELALMQFWAWEEEEFCLLMLLAS